MAGVLDRGRDVIDCVRFRRRAIGRRDAVAISGMEGEDLTELARVERALVRRRLGDSSTFNERVQRRLLVGASFEQLRDRAGGSLTDADQPEPAVSRAGALSEPAKATVAERVPSSPRGRERARLGGDS